MAHHRRRALGWAAFALVVVWTVAGAGYYMAGRSKVTAEKVTGRLHEVDLNQLSGPARADTLDDLAQSLAALPMEERRRARMDDAWVRWFAAMTDAEKSRFIEATMPLGVRQLMSSFEAMPEDKRRRAVSDALRTLQRARESAAAETSGDGTLRIATNQPPVSEQVQQQLLNVGLKAFYAQSSPQTRAELAPLLEEIQRQMETGRLFRGERR